MAAIKLNLGHKRCLVINLRQYNTYNYNIIVIKVKWLNDARKPEGESLGLSNVAI